MAAKYVRLAKSLRELILRNTGNGFFKLPSESMICSQYGLSRQTVRHALELLTEEGLIEKRKGSGSFSTGLSAKNSRIAIVVTCAEEYIYPSLLSDIKSVLGGRGYSARVYSTHSSVSGERKILEELAGSSVRGLIVEGSRTSLPSPNLDLYERLREQGAAVLFLHGHYPNDPGAVCIKDDNFYGGYLLGKHLFLKGHTAVAGIFKWDDMQGPERYHGFLCAARDFGASVPGSRILWYAAPELDALERRSDTGFLISFIQKQLKDCSAVVCYNDEVAYWLIRELQYAGLHVPADITVVCFDNSYLSEMGQVRITTLSHKKHEMGTAAAEGILQMIQGAPVVSRELPWYLAVKESDAPKTGK